ncbi:hypothetical protein ACJMK2_038900 [Sinanodonta woodiana]|uniref:Uncharacterized protein n=1 Tax=Sinanodonta woodiana TaxID=1069815 RepID=A0ABD3WDP7_SINWO
MSSMEMQDHPSERASDSTSEKGDHSQNPENARKSVNAGRNSQPGIDNSAFNFEELHLSPPPLTFVDFMPLCVEPAVSNEEAPKFAEFSTVMVQANQWLKDNPSFAAMKCETFTKKMENNNTVDIDRMTYLQSTYGCNKFVRGLRLWLMPKPDPRVHVQELAYITALPNSSDAVANSGASDLHAMFMPAKFQQNSASMPNFCGYSDTMAKLGKFLKKKPLPGSILNVENLKLKYDDTHPNVSLDSEAMSWVETGKSNRTFINAVRVYYVIGKPAFEDVGYYDELPISLNNFEMMSRPRFCPFTTVVERARKWLRQKKGIRVVNIQSVDVPCEKSSLTGEIVVKSNNAGYIESPGKDSHFARILRIFYINDLKSDVCLYESVKLTTRLFIPLRYKDTGKTFETFSKTMQRIVKWLQYNNLPVLGVEIVRYPFTPSSYGNGVNYDRSDMFLHSDSGKYFVDTVRLYFPGDFKEPPVEVEPDVSSAEGWGWWACVVS